MPATAAIMVPFALVLRRDEGIWKRVVEPVLEILKSVEVAEAVDEATARTVVAKVSVGFTWRANRAEGDVEPIEEKPLM